MRLSSKAANVSEDKVEAAICRHLDLPAPEARKISIFERLLGKRT